MDKLSNSIYTYYVDHFAELSLDKQFHFASRLYIWSEDEWAHQKIEQLRERLLPTGDAAQTLRSITNGSLLPLRHGSENLKTLREPYFARYPKLRTAAAMLYWALLLEHLYGTDARQAVAANISDDDLIQLSSKLMGDHEALAMLSTYAINFLYLCQRLLHRDEASLSPLFFKDIAATAYSNVSSDPRELQLKIYLLTHCIVADSLFYIRKLPDAHHKEYSQLLAELESEIKRHYAMIALDNKFEFLVCCRLADYSPALEESIVDEASRSVSPHGIFLIDTENTNRISRYTSLDKSEHRNALYILTQRPYKD